MTQTARGSALLQHYDSLEKNLIVCEEPAYGALVTPNGNGARPYHRWFHLKEGYSCDFLQRLLARLELHERDRLRIADPFVGSGTTLVSAHEWAAEHPDTHVEAVGIETNPFLHFVAATKVASLMAHERVLEAPLAIAAAPAPLPDLSTFRDPRFFEKGVVEELLRLRAAIDATEAGLARDVARLALASTVEPTSRLRRDGRTLRLWEGKVPADPNIEYERRLRLMLEDHAETKTSRANLTALLGDGRSFRAVAGVSDVDLVVFSPPYPNNIDYTEVYKLEAWFLGHYRSRDEFRAQRLRTLRSHPSVKFDDDMGLGDRQLENAVETTVKPILDAVPNDRYRHERRRMIIGYVADLAATLQNAREVLAPGGVVAVVVGNSLHGHGDHSVLIAADLVIADIAQAVGLRKCELVVARKPVRRSRSEPRLRESILILQ